jgi:hypothetical protein
LAASVRIWASASWRLPAVPVKPQPLPLCTDSFCSCTWPAGAALSLSTTPAAPGTSGLTVLAPQPVATKSGNANNGLCLFIAPS